MIRSDLRKKGLGALIFNQHVQAAKQAGFDYIDAFAAGDAEQLKSGGAECSPVSARRFDS
ncbi:MAG: hypothetical protein HY288_16640 [Planctomycetia bacterium]|nr:hypothetical protein [Planctomycetia bacterium]